MAKKAKREKEKNQGGVNLRINDSKTCPLDSINKKIKTRCSGEWRVFCI